MDSPTVLCIDDLPQVLELRKAALESHGYCVKTASSGYTAMKMLEETSVAAVLLEYRTEVDEHVMKSELPDGLVRIVEQATLRHKFPQRSVERCKGRMGVA